MTSKPFAIIDITITGGFVFVERMNVIEMDFIAKMSGELAVRADMSGRNAFWINKNLKSILERYTLYQFDDMDIYVLVHATYSKIVDAVVRNWYDGIMEKERYAVRVNKKYQE